MGEPSTDHVPGVPYYFASFVGYRPPLKPHNPIDYATAEQSRAFSAFWFDAADRVVAFEKSLVHSKPVDPAALSNAGRLAAGTHYFAATDQDSVVGKLLSLQDTKGCQRYYRATVGPGGTQLQRIERERMIRHDYEYAEDGSLRVFRFASSDGRSGEEVFDGAGNRVR